jgi:NADPH:quinone reductase-like Zn-dependent oxidoreductase
MRLLLWGQLYGRASGLRVFTPQAAPDSVLLERVATLASTGQVTPVIDRHFRLDDAAEALRYVEVQHASGKVVVTT